MARQAEWFAVGDGQREFRNMDGTVYVRPAAKGAEAPPVAATVGDFGPESLFSMVTSRLPKMQTEVQGLVDAGYLDEAKSLMATMRSMVDANRARLVEAMNYTGQDPMVLTSKPAVYAALTYAWESNPQISGKLDPRTNEAALTRKAAVFGLTPGMAGFNLFKRRQQGDPEATAVMAVLAPAAVRDNPTQGDRSPAARGQDPAVVQGGDFNRRAEFDNAAKKVLFGDEQGAQVHKLLGYGTAAHLIHGLEQQGVSLTGLGAVRRIAQAAAGPSADPEAVRTAMLDTALLMEDAMRAAPDGTRLSRRAMEEGLLAIEPTYTGTNLLSKRSTVVPAVAEGVQKAQRYATQAGRDLSPAARSLLIRLSVATAVGGDGKLTAPEQALQRESSRLDAMLNSMTTATPIDLGPKYGVATVLQPGEPDEKGRPTTVPFGLSVQGHAVRAVVERAQVEMAAAVADGGRADAASAMQAAAQPLADILFAQSGTVDGQAVTKEQALDAAHAAVAYLVAHGGTDLARLPELMEHDPVIKEQLKAEGAQTVEAVAPAAPSPAAVSAEKLREQTALASMAAGSTDEAVYRALTGVAGIQSSFWNSPQSRGLREYQELRNQLLPGKMDAAFGGQFQASAPWVKRLLELPLGTHRAMVIEGVNGPLVTELVNEVAHDVAHTPGADRTVRAITDDGIKAAVRPYVWYVVQQMRSRRPSALPGEENPAQASYLTRGADESALAWLDQDRRAKRLRGAVFQSMAALVASRVLGKYAPDAAGEAEILGSIFWNSDSWGGDDPTTKAAAAPRPDPNVDQRPHDEWLAERFSVPAQRAARVYANSVFAGLATPAPAAAPAATGVPEVAQGPGLQARARATTPETAAGATSAAVTAVMLNQKDFSWRQAIDTLVAVQKNIRRPAEDQALRDLFFDPNLERRALQEGIGSKFAAIQAAAITKLYQSKRQTIPEARRLLLEAYDTELEKHAKTLGTTKEEYMKRMIQFRNEQSQDDSPFTSRGSGSQSQDQKPTTSTPEDGGKK